ncbi:MAG: hypothetical protein E7364_05545 [Clostridiales bacterium]|nr:hypothetical protein [Clostridiales bacterium]
MRLYEEIFKNADGVAGDRCIIVPSGGGYFEGVKAVEDFTSDAMILCFARERVAVRGERLSIKKYCDGDMEISGKITVMEVLSKGGEP